jgi:Putative Ig domain
MRHYSSRPNIVVTILFSILAALFLNSCGDANNVTSPPAPAPPGPLTILTSSPLPAGTTGIPYDITLALSGGTPPYTWSLAPGSPALPTGLTLNPSTGNISGTPTAVVTRNTAFRLQDSTGQSVQKTLAITVNIAPTPLAILTNSLPNGSINQLYIGVALSPTGGTTPYTWGLKSGTPPLPSGLSFGTNGVISGTPTVTSNATHTFTLTDATSLTVEKALRLSISANPLSILTSSPLPPGTANQSYSVTLAATGGTGAYTWGTTAALPAGLSLNSSTGEISGIPTGTSNLNHTFTVTDRTPPTPQRASKALRLIIGGAVPDLIITTNSPLPPGTVTQPYNVTLTSTGGTGAKIWDISSGSLPAGLTLSPAGVISGTPAATGTFSPTFRVRDSGNPQDTATKQLSITINNPTPPNITTTFLPNGSFGNSYNQTLQVTGGIGSLAWGVIVGGLPPGLGLNASTGQISGTATQTGTFNFTVQVTDDIPQSDMQALTITINPPVPPTISGPASLPSGTVNQTYPNTTLTASGGTAPYTWDPVVSPALPNGLSWDADTQTISGIPLNGSQGQTSHTFTVHDSTNPALTGKRTYSLTIVLPSPPTITTPSLLSGMVSTVYSQPVEATGGSGNLTWTISAGSLPPGLNINQATGEIFGTPTNAGLANFTVQVTDTIPQSDTQDFSIEIFNLQQ